LPTLNALAPSAERELMSHQADQRFICRDLIVTRTGDGQTVVQSAAGGLPVVLPSAVADALVGCRGFRTIADHAARAVQRLKLPDSIRPTLAQGLELLARNGLLAAWSDLPSADDGTPGTPGIAAVAFLTRDRPEALARSLRSHAVHAREFGRKIQATVIDSSADPGGAADTHAMASSLARELDLPVRYAHARQRASYAARLAVAAGVRPDVVLFALTDALSCGHDTGCNRNALFLAHPNQLFLSSDDDVICRPHGSAAGSAALRVTSEDDPTKVQLFPSLAAAQSAVPANPHDLFAAHETLLGHRLSALMAARQDKDVVCDDLTAGLRRRILAGSAAVVVSASGILGDCGARFPSFYLWGPSVRDQLIGCPDDRYRSLVESRQIFRGAPMPTVTSGPFIMSTHVAFDNRQLLPPFFPVLRGQDLIFGRLLRLTFDDHLIGHVPVGILHEPITPRRAALERLWADDRKPTFPYLFDACLKLVAPTSKLASSGARRMQLVGRGLRDLGSLNAPEFESLLQATLAETVETRLLRWENQLKTLDPASAWTGDLRKRTDELRNAAKSGIGIAASELIERRGSEAAAKPVTQDLITRFGELLECWPALVDAARELEQAGRGLMAEGTV
jgi:hypothetical protein